MTEQKEETMSTADRELAQTRIYDAPRELVWKAWTEPEHLANWWGPYGFTNTIYEMDVRPGGLWRLVMHGPDGRDYQNEMVYLEVVKLERIVYDHTSHPLFRATVTFEDLAGKTKLTMRMVFESVESRNQTVKVFKADEGLTQTLSRLAELLAKASVRS